MSLATKPPRDGADQRRRALIGSVAIIVVLAGLLRLAFLTRRPELAAISADEAIVGLMAEDLRDRWRISPIFWGQHYGGTIEPALAGLFFKVAPATPITLKLVPMGLALAAWLNWSRLAARDWGQPSGVLFLAVGATWPLVYVQLSTLAYGFYWAFLLITSCFVDLAVRILDGDHRKVIWAGFGLIGGVAWWTTPLAIAVAGPILIWVLIGCRPSLRDIWPAIPGGLVGALPWISHMLHNLDSEDLLGPDVPDTTYLGRLATFVDEGLPRMTGLDQLLGRGSTAAMILGIALLVGAILGSVRAARRGSSLGQVATAVLLAYPFLHTVFPTSAAIGEGRYLLALWPFTIIGLVSWVRRPPALTAVLVAIPLALLATSGIDTVHSAVGQQAPDVRRPVDLSWAVDTLDHLGIDHAIGNYWIIHPIAFESDRRLVVSSPTDARRPAWEHEVASAVRVAYVIVNGSSEKDTFLDELDRVGLAHEVIEGPELTIVVVDRSAPPP